MATSSSNIAAVSNRDCGRHMAGVNPSPWSAVAHLANLAQLELRAVVGFAIDGPDLVEGARLPGLAAIGAPGRIVPDGKRHLAGVIAKGRL